MPAFKKQTNQQYRLLITITLGTIIFVAAGLFAYDFYELHSLQDIAESLGWISLLILPFLIPLWLPLSKNITILASTVLFVTGSALQIWSYGTDIPIAGVPYLLAAGIPPIIHALRQNPGIKKPYQLAGLGCLVPLLYFAVIIIFLSIFAVIQGFIL